MNAHTPLGIALLAGIMAVLPPGASAADNTYVYDDVSGWTIRTDVDRDYRCFAEAEYINGSVVRAGFNSDDGSFYMSVGDYSWDWVEEGVSYEIGIGFDDGSEEVFAATGTFVEADYTYPSVRVDVPDGQEQQFIRQFMDRREMHIAHGDDTLTLGLNGTRRATRTLDDCQLEMVSAAESESPAEENASASLE